MNQHILNIKKVISSGGNYAEAARECNISRERVRQLVNLYKLVQTPIRERQKKQEDRIVNYIKNGEPRITIARSCSCTITRVDYVKHKLGLQYKKYCRKCNQPIEQNKRLCDSCRKI